MEQRVYRKSWCRKPFFLLMLAMVAPLLMGALCMSSNATPIPGSSDPSGSTSIFGKTDFSQLKMFDANNGWATTSQAVLRTTDGGKSWSDLTPTDWEPADDQTPSNADGSIQGIIGSYFLDMTHAWIVAQTVTSQADINAASTAVGQATVTDSGTATFKGSMPPVGTSVYVRSTIDGGHTWMTSKPIAVKNLSGVSQPDFIDAHEGWMELMFQQDNNEVNVGDVYHTVDGGVTWTKQVPDAAPTGNGGIFATLSSATRSSLTKITQQAQLADEDGLSVNGQLAGLTVIPTCVTWGAGALPQCAAALPTPAQGCTVTGTTNYLGLATAMQAKSSHVWLSQELGADTFWDQTNFVPIPSGALKQSSSSLITSAPPIMFPNGSGILPVQMQGDPTGDDPTHYYLHLYSINVTSADGDYKISNLSPTSSFATPFAYVQHTLSAPDAQHIFAIGQGQNNGTYGDWQLYEFDGTNWITLTPQAASGSQTSIFNNSLSNLDFISDTEGWATDGPTLYHILVANHTATWSQVYPDPKATSAPKVARVPGKLVDAPTNPVPCGGTNPPPTNPPSTVKIPKHALTGYWQDFTNGSTSQRLSAVNANYDIIAVAFANADSANPGGVTFSIDPSLSSALGGYTEAQFTSDIATLHAAGKKVILSVGGQNGTISVADSTSASNFANSVYSIMKKYGFDGVDIDLENGLNPTYMANALEQLQSKAGSNLIITLAPQTIDMQSTSSDYFALALSIKNILTSVNTQFYNSGSMLGCDGKVYQEGTEDFLTALACTQIQGGLSPSQIELGLPASPAAAGSGYVAPAVVNSALDCLASGQNCGSFKPSTTYPTIRGAMDWSINWDAANGNSFSSTIKNDINTLP